VVVVDVTGVRVPVVDPVVAVGTEVELVGGAAVAVGTALGAATVVVEIVVVAGAPVLVGLVVDGAIAIVPLLVVDDVLLRRVRS